MSTKALIDRYEAQGPVLKDWLRGLTRADLLARPIPGKWTAQELILHMWDSDLVGSDRFKRIAAMDNPLIIGYDETTFVRSLHYDKQDPALAAELFESNRRMTAQMLRALPPEAWTRAGIHSERGRETLEVMLGHYVDHVEHHARFMAEKRRALGKN